ncbi:SGNH/GDSL hydrolase family protein [Enterococcus columbae]|uniref:SGNH hydrolase-type esterase domain-containing protein n=1 Tax=Enterococcus columbae DSM 7374 = ATCC 51263 TaxID=1121865 RepID=S0KHB0_9ENTE|nr:SGNH/GDSL hydrolase family protein [Enterococcus columbae]EOT44219.1 hypothetical protein OMW_00274 [Enterococcus columbae DSM 7374 = ATCC 51263]EOW84377.1 hypothetical protein I568_00872 [Enterococcus columbae DSM 7374 = ATCC 51263]OJG26064.1 hypothetical protein RR47_GL000862 [Enterococcus columbae DSM 7374 = ATCC 51263]
MKSSLKGLFYTLVIFLCAFCLFLQIIPKQPSLLKTSTNPPTQKVKRLTYVALGDSLTQGVGDETKRGGFVPLVSDQLQQAYQLSSIDYENFGKAGDRSDQILARLKKSTTMQKSLKQANVITLTCGGNDLLKVIKDNLFHLKKKTFKKPLKKYQRQVANLIEEIRKYNAHAPIYLLGIYNPFYLNFPEFTQMQEIVDEWNQGTKQIAADYQAVYFIPINDLLYKGLDNQVGIVDSKADDLAANGESPTISNHLLSEVDRFHPNNIGYRLMAQAVINEIKQTEKIWQPKEWKKNE